MATGDKKKTLERIDALFGGNTREKPKLLQMMEMMALNRPPQLPEEPPLKAPTAMDQAQSALENEYPFKR